MRSSKCLGKLLDLLNILEVLDLMELLDLLELLELLHLLNLMHFVDIELSELFYTPGGFVWCDGPFYLVK